MEHHTYGNADDDGHQSDQEQRTTTTGARNADFHQTGHSAAEDGEKKCVYKAAVTSLGLLCLLLLAGLLVLVYIFIRSRSAWGAEMVLLRSRFDNLTQDSDWLQVSLHNVSVQRDQLLARQEELQKLLAEEPRSCKTLKEVLKFRRPSSIKQERVQEGWQYFRGSYYLVSSTNNKTWRESQEDCQRRGADLLVINTQEEQAFANHFNKSMWIGLTDLLGEGTWRWVDGTTPSTSYWDLDEPNGAQMENCVEIRHFQFKNSWNDLNCREGSSWICEK